MPCPHTSRHPSPFAVAPFLLDVGRVLGRTASMAPPSPSPHSCPPLRTGSSRQAASPEAKSNSPGFTLATVDHRLLAENFPSRWQYYFSLVFLLLLSPNIFSHPLRSLLFSTSIPDCCQNVYTLNAGVPQAPHFALFFFFIFSWNNLMSFRRFSSF